METNFKISFRKIYISILSVILSTSVNGQICDSITPSFNVDLSASPTLSWTSPLVTRDGHCCGAVNPDKCLEFIITLNPDAIAVNFNIASGAIPPGALFYQIDCGPITPVGSPICLSGPGPFTLTFCKPGNNSNTFSITSYSGPITGPDITLGAGCNGFIYANYYNEPSMTWTSIFPGPTGSYDSFLNCTSGCDTVNVTPSGILPAYVDYLVCGNDIGGCNPLPICDTIRVNFTANINVFITPDSTHLCFGQGPVQLDAIASGGNAPYSYLWNTGDTTASIIAGAGNYSVDVTDSNGCTVATASAVVIQDVLPIASNAGIDQIFCNQSIPLINLNGAIQTATGAVWSGGNGTYFPDNTTLNAIYTPTAAEVASGILELILTTTGNNNCSAAQDTVQFLFTGFTETFTLNLVDVTCNGANDGQASISVISGIGLQYSWDMSPFSPSSSITNLAPGIHQLEIMNVLGCDTLINFIISEPSILTAQINSVTDVACNGGSTGSASVTANGGVQGYTYAWNSVPVQNTSNLLGVQAGNYTCTVTDANGCQVNILVNINQPAVLQVNLGIVPPSCNGFDNGAISSVVAGGTAPYDYLWNTGSVSSNIYDIDAGLYGVTVTDSNGCQVSVGTFVVDPPALTGTITPDTMICPGSAINLVASGAGGTGTLDYSWNPGGATTSSINIIGVTDQLYSCTITDNNGCFITLNTNITVSLLNPAYLIASIDETSICQLDSVELSAQYTGTSVVSLQWVHCPACSTSSSIYETPNSNTDYIISATDLCGQVIYDTVHVTVFSLPVIDVNPNMGGICPGGVVSFSNNASNDPSWDYTWDFGDGQSSNQMFPLHEYDNEGLYFVSLTITDNNNCTSTATNVSMVTVNPQAVAIFIADETEVSTNDPHIEFQNLSQNSSAYLWNFGDGSGSNLIDPEHDYAEAGYYTVTLYANNPWGCSDSTFITIHVKADFDLFVPNTFTPDGDEFNEIFLAKGYGISEKDYTFQIFNRWGDLIFESHDMEVGWTGTSKRDLVAAQDGTYTWVVYFKDLNNGSHRREGHVNLLK